MYEDRERAAIYILAGLVWIVVWPLFCTTISRINPNANGTRPIPFVIGLGQHKHSLVAAASVQTTFHNLYKTVSHCLNIGTILFDVKMVIHYTC
jgi:hypothetical protein